MNVQEKWEIVQQNIEEACLRSARNKEDVKVIAVTKYVSIQRMKEALEAGLDHIGESRAQDALPKAELLGNRGTWHFIGHLQTNKVKDVIEPFSYIHSLDRLSLAKEMNKRAEKLGKTISCFVQVNVSNEETKHGLAFNQVEDFIESLQDLPFIKVVGLMTMAPLVESPEEARPFFRELKQLLVLLQKRNWAHAPLQELSMGMSNDYQVAIEEGATFVRLGSCLVGE